VIGGFIQLPGFGHLHDWLNPTFNHYLVSVNNVDVDFNWWSFGLVIALIVLAFIGARDLYRQGPRPRLKGTAAAIQEFLLEKWYFDYLYNLVIELPTYALARLSWRGIDRGVIDGIVNGVTRSVESGSSDVAPVQSGYVRTYAITLFIGVLVLILIAVAQR